jgi:hypothetical protein
MSHTMRLRVFVSSVLTLLLGWGGIVLLFMVPNRAAATGETGVINAKFIFVAFPDRDFDVVPAVC